jgi:hypothetical protein
MADPSVLSQPDRHVLLGYDSDASELFEITVAVLGYHDPVLERFYQSTRATQWRCADLHC